MATQKHQRNLTAAVVVPQVVAVVAAGVRHQMLQNLVVLVE